MAEPLHSEPILKIAQSANQCCCCGESDKLQTTAVFISNKKNTNFPKIHSKCSEFATKSVLHRPNNGIY
jgi:hypothetical protein